jgi:hypothetical protein
MIIYHSRQPLYEMMDSTSDHHYPLSLSRCHRG